MSGRGRGCNNNGRGRGSYGTERSSMNPTQNTSGNKTTYKPSKKTLSDSIYYLGSAKQAADYKTTTQFLINHIRKTINFVNDIGAALEKESEYNLDIHKPTLMSSKDKDDDKREAANKQLLLRWRAARCCPQTISKIF
jgi:hypothetical protein